MTLHTCGVRFVATLLGLVLLGCGGSGVQPVHISGKITYRGDAVPLGSIVFESPADESGQPVRAIVPIEDGAYDTRTLGGDGVLPGDLRVYVEGYDGQATVTRVDEPSLGNPLFPPYQTSITVDEASDSVDIDIP